MGTSYFKCYKCIKETQKVVETALEIKEEDKAKCIKNCCKCFDQKEATEIRTKEINPEDSAGLAK